MDTPVVHPTLTTGPRSRVYYEPTRLVPVLSASSTVLSAAPVYPCSLARGPPFSFLRSLEDSKDRTTYDLTGLPSLSRPSVLPRYIETETTNIY